MASIDSSRPVPLRAAHPNFIVNLEQSLRHADEVTRSLWSESALVKMLRATEEVQRRERQAPSLRDLVWSETALSFAAQRVEMKSHSFLLDADTSTSLFPAMEGTDIQANFLTRFTDNNARRIMTLEFDRRLLSGVNLDILNLLRIIQRTLNNEMKLIETHKSQVRLQIPSLSILESAVDFLFHHQEASEARFIAVDGRITRDQMNECHLRDEHPIGLSLLPQHIIEESLDTTIDPFPFAIHDLFHGIRFYRLAPQLRQIVSTLYTVLSNIFSAHPEWFVLESMLNRLVDLDSSRITAQHVLNYIWKPMRDAIREGSLHIPDSLHEEIAAQLKERLPPIPYRVANNFLQSLELPKL